LRRFLDEKIAVGDLGKIAVGDLGVKIAASWKVFCGCCEPVHPGMTCRADTRRIKLVTTDFKSGSKMERCGAFS